MERILIIGGNGSGKTTFARSLAEKTGLPLVHLDSLYWKNWESVGREVFDGLLEQELVKPKWILDGNMNRTLPHRLKYCDTVFYLDFSSFACLVGVISRTIKYYGKTRPDMGPNCPEKISLGFYKQAFLYNSMHRKRYYGIMEENPQIQWVVLKNRRQVKRYLRDLSDEKVYSKEDGDGV